MTKHFTFTHFCSITQDHQLSADEYQKVYTLFFITLEHIFVSSPRLLCSTNRLSARGLPRADILKAQQPRMGNRKICLEVMKNKVYCHSRNERKLYARKPVVITIICPELPGV